MKITGIFRYIFLLLVLYLYVFNPYPFPGGSIKLLYPFAIMACLSKEGVKSLKKDKAIIMAFFLIFVYNAIWFMLGGETSLLSPFFVIVEFVLVPTGIALFYKHSFPNHNIMNDIIVVCIIASLITLVLAMNVELAFKVRLIFNENTAKAQSAIRRMFGISQYLLFTYSILMGFMSGYILFQKGYVRLFSILLFISVVLNARTGILAFCISVIMNILSNKFRVKSFLYLLPIFVVIPYLVDWFVERFPETYYWLIEASDDTQSFLKGNTAGTFEIMDKMIIFPDTTIGMIFGTGKDIFTAKAHRSDIGYIQQIYFGGLFYLCLLFFAYYLIIKKYYRAIRNKYIVMAIVLVILIANYKGNALSSNELIRFVVLVATCYSVKKVSLSKPLPIRHLTI